MDRVYERDTARDNADPQGTCYPLGLKDLRMKQLLKPRENNWVEKAAWQELWQTAWGNKYLELFSQAPTFCCQCHTVAKSNRRPRARKPTEVVYGSPPPREQDMEERGEGKTKIIKHTYNHLIHLSGWWKGCHSNSYISGWSTLQ